MADSGAKSPDFSVMSLSARPIPVPKLLVFLQSSGKLRTQRQRRSFLRIVDDGFLCQMAAFSLPMELISSALGMMDEWKTDVELLGA